PSWSMAAVAGMLHLTPGREAQVETKAVAILLSAAASGGCQAGSSLVFGSSPRDLLASFSPFTGGGETFREQPFLASPAAGQVGMTAASAAKRAGPRPVEPPKAVLKSTLGRFPTHSRVVNDLLALGLVALLGALSVFAAERRRAAHRRQMRIR